MPNCRSALSSEPSTVDTVRVVRRSCGGPESATQTCEWSKAERDAVESVPIDQFLGPTPQVGSATCGSSSPNVLYVSASIPDGSALPDAWFDRPNVGRWAATARLAETPNGEMVCYSTSSDPWRHVQVRVWADGTASAEIDRIHEPCSPNAL